MVGGRFLFSGESKSRTYFVCGVVGVDEAKAFAVFRPYWLEGFSQGRCVCVLMVCFVVMACCWVSGATRLLFYRSPLDVGKILLVAA